MQPRSPELLQAARLTRYPPSGSLVMLELSIAAAALPALWELRQIFGPDRLQRERVHNFRTAMFDQAPRGRPRRVRVEAELPQGFDFHGNTENIEPYSPAIHAHRVSFVRLAWY